VSGKLWVTGAGAIRDARVGGAAAEELDRRCWPGGGTVLTVVGIVRGMVGFVGWYAKAFKLIEVGIRLIGVEEEEPWDGLGWGNGCCGLYSE